MNTLKAVEPDAKKAAKVLRRRVYEAVEEVYDDRFKRYARGLKGLHTDAAIAAKLDCHENVVAKVREEFFGPAQGDEPTEQIKAMQAKIAHMEKEGQDLQALADGLRKQVVGHRKKIGVSKDEMKSMCEEHGWFH